MRNIHRLLIVLFLTATACLAAPLTQGGLKGTWDCTSATMLNDGKPGNVARLKPGSMTYTFTPDGKWTMQAGDLTHTKKSGNWVLRGTELVLRFDNGAPYQDWQATVSDDKTELIVRDSKFLLKFLRIS